MYYLCHLTKKLSNRPRLFISFYTRDLFYLTPGNDFQGQQYRLTALKKLPSEAVIIFMKNFQMSFKKIIETVYLKLNSTRMSSFLRPLLNVFIIILQLTYICFILCNCLLCYNYILNKSLYCVF